MTKNDPITVKIFRLLSIFLIELPVFLLLMPRGKRNIMWFTIPYILLCIILYIRSNKTKDQLRSNIKFPYLTVATSLSLALLFYFRWSFSGMLQIISGFIRFPPQQSCLILSVFLALFSIPGIEIFFRSAFPSVMKRKIEAIKKKKAQLFLLLYIFLTALIVISLNSECSPFYPFNTWGDPNFMMTVGKGVLKGYVPYRDLYEQKGPLLLFIHTAGAAISFTDFTGIWILEVIYCFLFLCLSYKTVCLFDAKQSLILFPAFAALIYSRWAFQTGDTAEEFCMPFLMYAILMGCKSIKAKNLPTKKECMLFGITSGCVFWIKYSMMGFYIGWALFFIIHTINIKQFGGLIKRFCWILLGFLLVTLPILFYFLINKSLRFLFTSYFYNNIFIYTESETTLLQNLKYGFEYLRLGNMFSIIMLFSGIIWLFCHRKWKTAGFLMCSVSVLFFFVYFSAKRYIYYGLIFSVFSVFALLWPAAILKKLVRFRKRYYDFFLPWSIPLGVIILCTSSRNMTFLDKQKKDLMQYKIKEIIEESGIIDPDILEYKTAATGVNMVTGLIPKNRFFCSFNLNLDEMEKEQDKCFEEACSDFVIIQTRETYDFEEYEQYIHLGGFEGNIHDTKRPYYYHLYQRKGIKQSGTDL